MIPPDVLEITINHSSRIQVLKKASDLSNAKRAQGAAFIISEKCVVIWADDPEVLLHDAQVMHDLLTTFLWQIAGNPSGMEGQGQASNCPSLQVSVLNLDSMSNSPVLSSDGGSSFRFPIQSNNTFSLFGSQGQLLVEQIAYDEKDEKDM